MQRESCAMNGCQRQAHVRGLCRSHYMRAYNDRYIEPFDHIEPMPCTWTGEAAAVATAKPTATAHSAKERDFASHDWPMSEWEPDATYLAALTWDDPEMVTDAERRLADWWERDRRIQNAHRVSLMSASLETAAD